MTIVLLVGSLQAWFLVLLLATKRDKQLPDQVLAVWLALIGAHVGSLYVHQVHGPLPLFVAQLNSAFPFLQGPLLYLYVDLLTSVRPRLRASHLLHLIPFAAFLLYLTGVLGAAGGHGVPMLTASSMSIGDGFGAWLLLSVPIYIAASLVLIRRYRMRLAESRSNVDRIHLVWLKALVAGMGLVWLAVILTVALQGRSGDTSGQQTTQLFFPMLTLFVYGIGYFGFRQTAVFTGRPAAATAEAESARVGTGPTQQTVMTASAEAEPSDTPTKSRKSGPKFRKPGPKYRKSGLDAPGAAALRDRLRQVMAVQRPYLEQELTLTALAERVGSPSNHLSQVINDLEGLSFYDFVNRYRVEAAASQLRDPELRGLTILDIAFDSGFASKSTFNRIFRAHIGSTPSQYRARGEDPVEGEMPRPSG